MSSEKSILARNLDVAALRRREERTAAIARGSAPSPVTLEALVSEVRFARGKFPGNRFLLAALTEEVGELAQALLQRQGDARVCNEALQVACVALRIAEEGDALFDGLTEVEAKP